MAALRIVFVLALAVWVGTVVFFSFVVAPVVFRVLDPAQAGEVVGAVFPHYYRLGLTAGAVSVTMGLVLARAATARRRWAMVLASLTLALAASAWAGLVVQPQARQLRASVVGPIAASPVAEAFHRLHRRAVALNVITLTGSVIGLGIAATALRS